MITSVSLPVETERLVLRRFVADDFAAYAEYHRREDVYRFLYAPPPLKSEWDSRKSG